MVVGAAALALHFFSVTSTRWAALASAVPWMLCCIVVGLAAFLLARQRVAAGAAAALLVAVGLTQAPLLIGDEVTNDGARLTVLTSNLEFGRGDPDVVASLVADNDVDLLLVQELTDDAASILTGLLADTLPHHYLVPGDTATGSGIYSRYPLTDTHTLPDTFLATLFATATVRGYGPVRIGSAHPVPPWPVHRRGWERELGQIRATLHGYDDDSAVVVGGDFNATWNHPEFRSLLDHGYRDAAEQAGAGWLPTYPADRLFPLIGIDHVILRGAQADRVQALTIPGTDHRAVLAEVVLP